MAFINIKGINIFYNPSGRGRPLIFLHAMLYDSGGYNRLIKILGEKYTIYAIDMPMHGKSEKPKEYLTISDFTIILREFVRKLGLGTVTLCGHSGGCLVAIEYASKYQARELVLIEPAGLRYYKSIPFFLFKLVFVKTPF